MCLPLLVWKVNILLAKWYFHISILLTTYSLYTFQLLHLRFQAPSDQDHELSKQVPPKHFLSWDDS